MMLARDIKLFFSCLLSSLVLIVLVVALCLMGASALSLGKGDISVNISVVDNEDSAISRILINAVKNTEYLSRFMKIEKTDIESATAAVASGEKVAAVILPENFVSDIAAGRISKGLIYIGDSAEAYSEMIISAARFGEKLLVSAQQGIFVGEHFIKEYNMGEDYHNAFLRRANSALLNEALSDYGRYMDFESLSYLDTAMPESNYFAMCWILTLLFLISIFFSELFLKDMSRSMLSRLASYNVGFFRFFISKMGIMFILRLIVLMAAHILITSRISVIGVASAILSAAFITLVGGCLTVSFADNVSATVIVCVGGIFLCGGIVPRQLMPSEITLIGDLTPFGGAKLLAAPLFGGEFSPLCAFVSIAYSLLALLILYREYHRRLIGGDT